MPRNTKLAHPGPAGVKHRVSLFDDVNRAGPSESRPQLRSRMNPSLE